MKHIVLFIFFLFSIAASAKDCTKELLKQKPGTWKAGPQGSINNVSAPDLTKEKLVIAGVHKMVSTNYKPTGCEISYSTVYGKYLNAGQTG